MNDQTLTSNEIEMGVALSALINHAQHQLQALLLTQQLYVDQLRARRGLGDEWVITDWAKGFEHGQQNNQ